MKFDFLNPKKHVAKHRLDPARIVETAQNLAQEVGERLPGTTLAGLAAELLSIAHSTEERATQASKPIHSLRIASAAAIGIASLSLLLVAFHIHARWEFATITEVFESMSAGVNLVALLAGAIWFLASFEARIKRRRALQSVEELREFIHVIDVTQLYFTPILFKTDDDQSLNSQKLDHTYLLYCTQMLALIANLAALYSRDAAGDSIMRAVFEVELLANTITSKLQSKVESIRAIGISH